MAGRRRVQYIPFVRHPQGWLTEPVIPLIDQNRDALVTLCHRHSVKRLEVFGSASTGDDFDDDTSDLDFLVDFLPLPEGRRADTYFELYEALQSLFGRPIDLVVLPAVTNPYFLEAVEPHRELLYAA